MNLKISKGVLETDVSKAIAAIDEFERGTGEFSRTVRTKLARIRIGIRTRCVKRNQTWFVLTHEEYNSFIKRK